LSCRILLWLFVIFFFSPACPPKGAVVQIGGQELYIFYISIEDGCINLMPVSIFLYSSLSIYNLLLKLMFSSVEIQSM
jgi:hypothetical protein